VITKQVLQKSILQDSFFDFVQYFWDTVIPEEPVWNWHIKYVCDEMQRLAERVFLGLSKKHDLIINVPPGSTKSTICSVMFPAWIWTRMSSARSICGSYSSQLSLDLSRKTRLIVSSEKFQRLFKMEFRKDQDTKGYFVNEYEGGRYSTSTGGTVTGFHAHFIIVDDPLSPLEATSEVELKKASTWINETLSSRKVDKNLTPTILIMQRLHEEDPSGNLLNNKDLKIRHINLPAEINSVNEKSVRPRSLRRKYTPDPKQEGTKLLDPVRMNREALKEALAKLLDYGYAGQFLQSPVPPEGGMFKIARINIEDSVIARADIVRSCRFWDKAGTKDGGAFTVGLLMSEDKNGRFWIEDVIRTQLDSGEREKLIKQIAQIDGTKVIVGLEQEGGSGGKESAENTVRNLAGYPCEVIRPTGPKENRAQPFSSQVNVGNVYMKKAEWNRTYLNELILFPNSKYKDQVDASSGAFTILAFPKVKKPRVLGVF